MPTEDLFEEAARRPDLRLAGCCLDARDWSTECVSCGQRQYLGDDSSQWTTSARPATADLMTRYAGLARAALGAETASAVSYAGSSKLIGQVRGGESGAGPLGAGAVEADPAP